MHSILAQEAELQAVSPAVREIIKGLERQVRDLTNREYYLRQELLSIQDAMRPVSEHPDMFRVGRYLGSKPGDLSLPCDIPLPVLQRSIALLGQQGAGKSNLGYLLSPQLRQMGVRQLVLDRSGEWRSLFEPAEILEAEDIHINPFSDYGGLLRDRDISAFFKYTFMSYFNATKRSATNLARIGKALHYYMHDVREGRTLRGFLHYLHENQERLQFPKATFDNITGSVEAFLFDDDLREIFDVDESSPHIVALVRGEVNGCVQLGAFEPVVRSIVTVSILRHIARRMQREFHQLGSIKERRLSLFVTIEETVDLIRGKAEVDFVSEMLRDSRKAGLGFLLFARDEATLKELGVDNLLSAVGCIFFFRNNETISVKNPKLKQFIDQYMFDLPPGRAVFYKAGQFSLVQTNQAFAVRQ